MAVTDLQVRKQQEESTPLSVFITLVNGSAILLDFEWELKKKSFWVWRVETEFYQL